MPQAWRWNRDKERALELVFQGRYSQAKIADELGVPLRTLERWIARPEFQERLDEMRTDITRSLGNVAYLRKEQRLIALAQLAEQAREDFEARPTVRETRAGNLTSEQFNTAAFNAVRAALDDIAKELGARRNVIDIYAEQEAESQMPEVVTVMLTTTPPPEPVDPFEQEQQQQGMPPAVVDAARGSMPPALVSLQTRPPAEPADPDAPDDPDDSDEEDDDDGDSYVPLVSGGPRRRW